MTGPLHVNRRQGVIKSTSKRKYCTTYVISRFVRQYTVANSLRCTCCLACSMRHSRMHAAAARALAACAIKRARSMRHHARSIVKSVSADAQNVVFVHESRRCTDLAMICCDCGHVVGRAGEESFLRACCKHSVTKPISCNPLIMQRFSPLGVFVLHCRRV